MLGCNLKNNRDISVHFQGKPFSITVIQVYASTNNAKEAEVQQLYEDIQDLLELTPKKKKEREREVCFIIGDCNAKLGSHEIPGVRGKCALGIQNEAGQRLKEFCQEIPWPEQKSSSNNTRDDSTHGHHQMVNIKIRLVIFFAAKDGVALYREQKEDQDLTVAQIINSLLQNSDLNKDRRENHEAIQG